MINIIKSDIEFINIDLNFLKNKSVLITGSTGLLGIYFLASLKKFYKEFNIKIYTWSRNQNPIFEELFEDCYKIISDITDDKSFNLLPKFDCIIHASGYGQPSKFLDESIKTIEINTSVLIKLINHLNENGKFLFISSSEVYNGIFKNGIEEEEIGTTDPFHPRSAYIEAKRCGECICNIYRLKGKDIKIGRLSISYGPGSQLGDSRVINSIINKGLIEENIKLIDNGDAIRTICYISDVIEMFWNILLKGKDFVYNIGGIHTLSILEIANMVGNILNKEIILPELSNELKGNPKYVNLSINRYINEFNKISFVSLEDGMNKNILWNKQLIKI